ncbi:ABC transporter ATP-binding protein [Acetatifactor aquisgranensis]|uniref:ABC transporter ATP-binding protein n=1 Tax=Acetatifactor aquisgranensis TaxID=2941233 RepID=UPI00203C8F74|nr:ABC transporter ATP-binding protein [Acetatifactor aquisgranensis]
MEKGQETFAVETLSLTKVYDGKAAVNHLNMQVRERAIYGFIGRNGAGKSTTLKMICGLARPTEGEIRLFGKTADNPCAARRIGSLIESTGLYPKMSARQNLIMKARCMGLTDESQVDAALNITGLADTGKKMVRHFSMGMKQRLGVALALLGNPDLLILDEPINGLDPEGIREVRQLLLTLCEEGKTIIVSSHILGELSKIATHYGIIKEGNLVEQIDQESLERKCKDYFQIEVDDCRRALPLLLERMPGLQTEVPEGGLIRIYDLSDSAWVNKLLIENQVQVYASGFHHMDLEEYFLNRMDDPENGRKAFHGKKAFRGEKEGERHV